MTNDQRMTNDQLAFDLEKRTAAFGEAVIEFAKQIPINEITRSIVDQIVHSATSIGANYCEADDAISQREFRQKIGYCAVAHSPVASGRLESAWRLDVQSLRRTQRATECLMTNE